MQAPISTHPSDQVLRSFGNGQLDPASADSVSTHLDECEECLRKVAGLSSDGFLEAFRKARPRRDTEPHRSGIDLDQPRAARRPSLVSTEAMTPPPGAEIPTELANHPDYTILRELGRGGMGVVYLAENKLLVRWEALKVVSSHLLDRPGVLDRFLAEIRSAARFEHTNVVTAYSALRLGEGVVLAMQYVEGLDLARLVDSRGPLPVAHACFYAHQAALGLQHAHEHGMVHRDIKPSNLMLTRQGNRHVIKVLDFGLAKVRSEGPADGTLTLESQILGTPDFIAPEQIRNARRADIRADIYSLGCTLYFLLTGRPPFQGACLYDTLQAHHSVDAKPLNRVRPDVPVELAALVAKMMAKEPERRFQEPKAVAQALIPFFKQGASRPSGPSAEMPTDVSRTAATATLGTASAPAQSPPPLPTVDPPGLRASKTRMDGVDWQSLIEIKEDEPQGDATRSRPAESKPAPAEGPVRRPPWMRPAIMAASMLGLVALGVIIIITFRRENGETKFTFWYRPDPPKGAPAYPPVASLTVKPLPAMTNSIGMKLMLIPAGKFLMGSADDALEGEVDERPLHRVRITRPFYLGSCEVTQEQYEAVMGKNPSHFSATGGGAGLVGGQSTAQYPVENVSWFDAITFCNKLSEKERLKPFYEIDGADVRVPDWNGQGYRLPTEAEWEYACRANAPTPTKFSFGENHSELPAYAWFDRNSEQRTHPVGQKKADPFGLHDMHGNVWEWCWDWYSPFGKYYAESPADDPTGPLDTRRVLRGGSINFDPRWCRSAKRGHLFPVEQKPDCGFRVARGAADRPEPKPGPPSDTDTLPPPKPAELQRVENAIGMKLMLIPAGEFFMGSPDGAIEAENDERPLHRVRITRPFYLGVYEVTQEQYEAVMGKNPSHFSATGGGAGLVGGQSTAQYPVENVSWFDAIRFCNQLSEKERIKPFYQIDGADVRVPDWNGQGYRLPTEAEWEYACRANASTPTRFSFGDGRNLLELQAYAWFDLNSEQRTHPVGQKKQNPFGFHDMHGNVAEWCWDWLGEYSAQSPADDPTGGVGTRRVLRGGCISLDPRWCRSAKRCNLWPVEQKPDCGFRVARGAADRPEPKPDPPGGTGPSITSHPFRVMTNGLAGRPFIDPITFGPDGLGFNDPGTALPWVTKDAFARPRTRGTLGFPRLPVSRYVFDVELTVNRGCDVLFRLGDPLNACDIALFWKPDIGKIRCELHHWRHGWWYWSGERDFAPGARLNLKLVVGDVDQKLFHEGRPILGAGCWPTDCRLLICSGMTAESTSDVDSAVIQRCSLRPLTAQDVAACEWPIPPTRLPLDAGDARERLRRIFAGYPERPKDGKRFAVKTTGTPMAWIPPGTFEMGSRDPKDEGRHRVQLTKGYWMAQIEVTQGAYQKVTGANPSRVTGSPHLPVDWVPWDEAAAYCRNLTDLERAAHRLPDGYEYRLPTEAEWEYACRAGSDRDFSVPQESVWSRERSGRRPHEVAESQPNDWGLYDMHGNAMEWCLDAWSEYPKGKKEVTVDPFKIGKPDKDTAFVVRGGAWWAESVACTSHWRFLNHNNANGFRGFRIVLGPEIRDPNVKN